MDSKENASGAKEQGKEEAGFPCGDFQKMSEMMKNCDCRTMMATMMGPGKRQEAPSKPAAEAEPQKEQHI